MEEDTPEEVVLHSNEAATADQTMATSFWPIKKSFIHQYIQSLSNVLMVTLNTEAFSFS